MPQHANIPPIWSSGHCARGAALQDPSAHRSAQALSRTYDKLAFMIGRPATSGDLAGRVRELRLAGKATKRDASRKGA